VSGWTGAPIETIFPADGRVLRARVVAGPLSESGDARRRALGVDVPSWTQVRVSEGDLGQIDPVETRADLVLLLDENDEPHPNDTAAETPYATVLRVARVLRDLVEDVGVQGGQPRHVGDLVDDRARPGGRVARFAGRSARPSVAAEVCAQGAPSPPKRWINPDLSLFLGGERT
jgi:hypothetical protein